MANKKHIMDGLYPYFYEIVIIDSLNSLAQDQGFVQG